MKLKHYMSIGIVVVTLVLTIAMLIFAASGKIEIKKLNHSNLEYYNAVYDYKIKPYYFGECLAINETNYFKIDYFDGKCAYYEKGQLNYFIECVEIKEKELIDHCGVSSKAW
jgi:hypothetical protein